MTDEDRMDLRSLGDVESPEVVSAALRRFRRNAMRTTSWVAVVGLVALTFALGANARESIAERINSAEGVEPGAVYKVQGMTAVLRKVADTGDLVGLHVVVAAPDLRTYGDQPVRDAYDLRVQGSRFQDGYEPTATAYDLWVQVSVPQDGRITVEVIRYCALTGNRSGVCRTRDVRDSKGSFVIDLTALGVPRSLWS